MVGPEPDAAQWQQLGGYAQRLRDKARPLRNYFGFGDQGRIVAVDNWYAKPAAVDPQSRAVPIVVKVSANG